MDRKRKLPEHRLIGLWYDCLDFKNAAAGLLRDVIQMMAERDTKQLPDDPQKRKYAEEIFTWWREAVMEILDDKDGGKLRKWIRLLRDDPAAFDALARSWVDEFNKKLAR